MTGFLSWIQGMVRPLKCFFLVKPWEQAVRVRLGKNVVLCGAGLHWKIPFLDSVSIQATRRRIVTLATQTAMTRDGDAVTIGLVMQYRIDDLVKVFRNVHHPEQTLQGLVQGMVGEHVRTLDSNKVTPEALRSAVAALDVAEMGIADFRVFVTDLARVKTFRVIQDGRWTNPEFNVETMGRDA